MERFQLFSTIPLENFHSFLDYFFLLLLLSMSMTTLLQTTWNSVTSAFSTVSSLIQDLAAALKIGWDLYPKVGPSSIAIATTTFPPKLVSVVTQFAVSYHLETYLPSLLVPISGYVADAVAWMTVQATYALYVLFLLVILCALLYVRQTIGCMFLSSLFKKNLFLTLL